MDSTELYDFLKAKFQRIVSDADIAEEEITAKPVREDVLEAEFRGTKGQVMTREMQTFRGKVSEICALPLTDCKNRSLFAASVNAVMGALGYATRTTHCAEEEPDYCAMNILHYVQGEYGNPKIALIGAMKPLVDCLSKTFRVLAPPSTSLADPETKAAVDEADLVVCTGSVICDGTLADYLNLDKEVIFYGISLAGTADWLGVKRLCF